MFLIVSFKMPYEPRSKVKQFQQFNSLDGVSSFHLKWIIGKFPDIDVKSDVIEAGTLNGSPRPIKWKLSARWSKHSKFPWMSLTSIDDTKIPLRISRFLLVSERMRCNEYGHSNISSESHFVQCCIDDSNRAADDFVLHCWLDVPNENYIDTDSERLFDSSGVGSIWSGICELFDEEVIKEGDIDDDSTSDVVLITKKGTERRFNCHRNILCMRSPIFKTMLTNKNFKEAGEREVEIEDIDGNTMERLLEFVYVGKDICFGSKEDTLDLMVAADKYALPELVDECILEYILNYFEDVDYVDLLGYAELLNLKWVKNICLMTLSTNMNAINDEDIRGKISVELMGELGIMCAKRARDTKFIDVSGKHKVK